MCYCGDEPSPFHFMFSGCLCLSNKGSLKTLIGQFNGFAAVFGLFACEQV